MKPKRIMVTGGCGFIGSNLIRYLLSEERDELPGILVNVDALTYAGNHGNLVGIAENRNYRFEDADILNEKKIYGLLREYNIDTVVHFAAESHVDRSIDNPEAFFHTNVIGTLRLLNGFREHWIRSGRSESYRFVHISTDEVYGTLETNAPPFREDTPFAPNSPYAASKASSNHIVRACHKTYKLPVVTTNSSNNYGPFQFPEKFIPHVILSAVDGRPIPVYGDGNQIRDWLYVKDSVKAICRILEEGRVGDTYNIGGMSPMANIKIARIICSLLDKKVPRENGRSYAKQINHVADRPGHDRRYEVDCEKITRELGWAPMESLASGLEKTVAWYLDNRRWVEEVTGHSYSFERFGSGEVK